MLRRQECVLRFLWDWKAWKCMECPPSLGLFRSQARAYSLRLAGRPLQILLWWASDTGLPETTGRNSTFTVPGLQHYFHHPHIFWKGNIERHKQSRIYLSALGKASWHNDQEDNKEKWTSHLKTKKSSLWMQNFWAVLVVQTMIWWSSGFRQENARKKSRLQPGFRNADLTFIREIPYDGIQP